MKKWLLFILAALSFTGCGVQETFETIGDVWDEPALAVQQEISVELPGESAAEAMQGEVGKYYLCDGYEITIDTMESGDLNSTIRSMTGFSKDELTVMTRAENGVKRYDFVWSAAGEKGERLGRGVILDDGNYHYTMSVIRDQDQEETSQIVWSRVFQSFCLI